MTGAVRLARTRLLAVTLTILLSQAGAAVVSGIALAGFPAPAVRTVSAADDHACCRGLGPGRMCPMHKAAAQAKPASSAAKKPDASCRLSSGCAPKEMVLTVVPTTLAVLTAAYRTTTPRPSSSLVGVRAEHASSWTTAPALRPPRS